MRTVRRKDTGLAVRTRTTGIITAMLAAAAFAAAGADAAPPDSGAPHPTAQQADPTILELITAGEAAAPVSPRYAPAPRAGEADPRGERTVRRAGAEPPRFVVAEGTSATAGTGPLRTFVVEVDESTGQDPAAFAAAVERILFDPRSWTAGGRYTLQRVDSESADFGVTLASPDVVDLLCAPLDTRGEYSCWNEERAVINHWRWRVGADTYGGDLAGYRRYLVNHEVGHALGRGHVGCPSPGASAPVMMQQSVGLDACVPSPWPFPDG